jgi:NAD(P)-dependent dehydrogenase (short-subunit alcohol dehydrogenase family)
MQKQLYILIGASLGMGLAIRHRLRQGAHERMTISRRAEEDLAVAARKAAASQIDTDWFFVFLFPCWRHSHEP